MNTLSSQIESTRERLVREQKQLVQTTERARRALARAAREEAANWQTFLTGEQERAREALRASLELVRSRTGIERVVLRVADRTLADVHASVRSRLGAIDRELSADVATESKSAPRVAEKVRPRARRAANTTH